MNHQQAPATGQPLVASPQHQERDLATAALRAARQDQDSPGMQALCRLLRYRLEQAKSTLLLCPQDEFAAAQARARVYAQILKEVFGEQ